MRTCWYSFALLALFGCGQNDLYRSTVKSADSLSGVVSSVLSDLHTPDSVEIKKYQRVFSYYNQFILQNVNDTVSKSQADALQAFFAAGKQLDSFQYNHRTLNQRGSQIIDQLKILSNDLVERSIPAQDGLVFFTNEKKAAQELIMASQASKRNLLIAVQNLKNSLKEVEYIIRSRNNGDLPTIVKDSLTSYQ